MYLLHVLWLKTLPPLNSREEIKGNLQIRIILH